METNFPDIETGERPPQIIKGERSRFNAFIENIRDRVKKNSHRSQ